MKSAKAIETKEDVLLKTLKKEASTNDNKILVYPYFKRKIADGKVDFDKEWHVMKEGNKSSRKFKLKSEAVQFADKLNKANSGKVYISR